MGVSAEGFDNIYGNSVQRDSSSYYQVRRAGCALSDPRRATSAACALATPRPTTPRATAAAATTSTSTELYSASRCSFAPSLLFALVPSFCPGPATSCRWLRIDRAARRLAKDPGATRFSQPARAFRSACSSLASLRPRHARVSPQPARSAAGRPRVAVPAAVLSFRADDAHSELPERVRRPSAYCARPSALAGHSHPRRALRPVRGQRLRSPVHSVQARLVHAGTSSLCAR